ncbi:MAG TPA: hypothetical protein VEX13_17720 [Chloroflexia bacterium]|nr:hypothetical protein [Chloroflexia bacterium]
MMAASIAKRTGRESQGKARAVATAFLTFIGIFYSVLPLGWGVQRAHAQQAAPIFGMALDLSGSTLDCTDRERRGVSAALMYLDLLRPSSVVLIPFYSLGTNDFTQATVYDLNNDDQYKAARQKLIDLRNDTGRYNTPLYSALTKAADKFRELNAPPGSRLMVLTDGAPTDQPHGEIRRALGLEEGTTGTWDKRNWHIDTIGLKGSGCSEEGFLSDLKVLSDKTGGVYKEAASAEELGPIFIEAFNRLKGYNLNRIPRIDVPQSGTTTNFTLDSSARDLYVIAFKQKKESEVSLKLGGQFASDPATGVSVNIPLPGGAKRENDFYWLTKVNPAKATLGGTWEVSLIGSGWVDLYYVYVTNLSLQLVYPKEGQTLRADQPDKIQVRLLASGQPETSGKAQISGTIKGSDLERPISFQSGATACDPEGGDGSYYTACLDGNSALPEGTYSLEVRGQEGEASFSLTTTLISSKAPTLDWARPQGAAITSAGDWPKQVVLATITGTELSPLKVDAVLVQWLDEQSSLVAEVPASEVTPEDVMRDGGRIKVQYNPVAVARNRLDDTPGGRQVGPLEVREWNEEDQRGITITHQVRIYVQGTYRGGTPFEIGKRDNPQSSIGPYPFVTYLVEKESYWNKALRWVGQVIAQYWPWILLVLASPFLLLFLFKRLLPWLWVILKQGVKWTGVRLRKLWYFLIRRIEEYPFPTGFLSWHTRSGSVASVNLSSKRDLISKSERLSVEPTLAGALVHPDLSAITFSATKSKDGKMTSYYRTRREGRRQLMPNTIIALDGLRIAYSAKKGAPPPPSTMTPTGADDTDYKRRNGNQDGEGRRGKGDARSEDDDFDLMLRRSRRDGLDDVEGRTARTRDEERSARRRNGPELDSDAPPPRRSRSRGYEDDEYGPSRGASRRTDEKRQGGARQRKGQGDYDDYDSGSIGRYGSRYRRNSTRDAYDADDRYGSESGGRYGSRGRDGARGSSNRDGGRSRGGRGGASFV